MTSDAFEDYIDQRMGYVDKDGNCTRTWDKSRTMRVMKPPPPPRKWYRPLYREPVMTRSTWKVDSKGALKPVRRAQTPPGRLESAAGERARALAAAVAPGKLPTPPIDEIIARRRGDRVSLFGDTPGAAG